jgi:O-succinylbenzoate synthase
MVDANCGYGRHDMERLEALDDFGLLMIEQPFEYDELEAHAELRRRIETPICLDESAKSVDITARALDLGAADIVNIKCSRLGGRLAGIAVHDLCAERGVPVWCGGMLESGIGRLHNISIASLPNFSMSNDLSASRRYWERDIIDPEVVLAADGTVGVPQAPGIGHEVLEQRIEEQLERRKMLRAAETS